MWKLYNNFNNNNFENDFNTTIAVIDIKRNHINSSYIYNDIDNQWQNLTLQLLSAIANIKLTISNTD